MTIFVTMEVKGLRVVRGLEWKWGEQDGGEGFVGTVVSFKNDDSSIGKKTLLVTVIWDIGTKGRYPVGPEGAFDLLILDSASTGVKHKDVPCHSCKMPEILGMRWQCTDCSANFCSSCFYRIKELHNQHYGAFHRYDSPESEPVLRKLDDEKKLVELRGIYEGAKVTRGRDWFYGKEDDDRTGVVLKSITLNRVRVKWTPENIKTYRRGADGKVDLKAIEAAVGGHYDPLWLPILGSKSSLQKKDNNEIDRQTFYVDDLVQVGIKPEEFREKQAEFGGWHPEMSKLISLVGTVKEMSAGTVTVQFDGSNKKWFLNPAVLKKLSQFSIGQIVRVKDDIDTFKAIQSTLGNKIACSLATEIGRIFFKKPTNKNEEQIFLELMDLQSKDAPMKPEWLEAVPVSTKLHNQFSQIILLIGDLFVEAAREDDFYLVRELVTFYNVSVDAGRKVDGSTALHLACLKGHLNVIRWLIEKKADLEKEDLKGRRAVYYAVKGCQSEVLKLLISKGIELDPLTKKKKMSPLLKAVCKKYTDCAQILMENNCNINLQDEDGDTALHKATSSKMELFEALLQCDRVDLTLKNRKGYNIFHLAVKDGNVPVVQLLLSRQESLALKRVENSQYSALHLACIKGDLQVVHLLLERFKERLSVNDVDIKGRTALMMACRRGHYDIIEFLVESGADINILDYKCNTAISWLMKKMRFHRAPLPDVCFDVHQIYTELLVNNDKETVTQYPYLSAVCYLIKKGGKLEIAKHTEDPKAIKVLQNYTKDVHMEIDDSDECKLVVDETSVCILCSSQANPHIFKCCNTTSSLTCSECYFNMKNCPQCKKPLESYRLNHRDLSDDDDELDDDMYLNGSAIYAQETIKEVVNEEAVSCQHSVEHNYQKPTTSSTAEKLATPAVANPPKSKPTVTLAVIPQQKVIPTVQTLVPVMMMATRSSPSNKPPNILRLYPARKDAGAQLNVINKVAKNLPALPPAVPLTPSAPVGAIVPLKTTTPDESSVEFAKNLGLTVAEDVAYEQLPLNYKVIGKSRKQAELIQDSEGNTYTKRNTGTGVLQCTKKQSDSKNRCTAILFKKNSKWFRKGDHRCLKQASSSTSSLLALPSNNGASISGSSGQIGY